MTRADRVFLDTSGWVALLNRDDDLHELASKLWTDLSRSGAGIVLTDWIIAETGNGLARCAARRNFPESVRRLRGSPRVQVALVDDQLIDRALSLYGDRADKSWGIVDCASFLVMADTNTNHAFSADFHFEQSGFRSMLHVRPS